ncbi:hypothetical protein LTR86_001516 [Recurvomyces mirabilis]|nr:hypothetical protein LTR86_001516 [Recurvomyces mirabilis]
MSGEQDARDVDAPSPGETWQPSESGTVSPWSRNPSFNKETLTSSSGVNLSSRPMPDLAKKYIGGSFWSSLTDEVNALADVLDNDDLLNDNDTQDDAPQTNGLQYAISAPSVSSYDLLQHKPLFCPPTKLQTRLGIAHDINRWDVPRLLKAYSENVEPPHKLFHIPSLRALVISAAPYLQKPADEPSNQFLKTSVCFAGLNALTNDECWALYGMPKEQAVYEFKSVVDMALQRADPLVSTDMATLQALLLYAMTIRITDSSRRSWSIGGLVAQTARSMYLHRATPNESPYMGQVRLRLWHCVVFMDHYSSRDRGTESIMRGWCPSPTMPIDCNDDDFDEYSTHIEPRAGQITDMTIALISFGGVVASTAMEQPGQTWKQRLDLAEQYRAKLDREVRPLCERSLPKHQYIMKAATIVCHSMVLRAVRPLQLYGEESPPSVSDPWVLRIGVDLLQSALELLPLVESGWRRMPWIPWHAIVVVLAGLCTIRDTDLANQAWPLVERAMVACESDVADTKDGMLWRPIKKVHAKAVAYREAGNIQVTEHMGDAQAFDHSIAGAEYQHDFGDFKGFAQFDATGNVGYIPDSSGTPSNGMELPLPLPDDSWLNWEAIMTDLGADEALFRDGF